VNNGKATFGQQEFALAEGEVLIMRADFSIQQIPSSKAGSYSEERKLKGLSELFEQSASEQVGTMEAKDGPDVKLENR